MVQVLLALAEAAVRCRRLEMSTRDRWPPGCSYCLDAVAACQAGARLLLAKEQRGLRPADGAGVDVA